MLMKSFLSKPLTCFFICLSFVSAAPRAGAESALLSRMDSVRVDYVIDGDTIILEDGRHVRYIGINCPEVAHRDRPGEPFGKAAERFNRQLVEGKAVRLEYDQKKTDRYGRTLAYVFPDRNLLVNRRLVEAGMAFCLYDRKTAKYADALLNAQRRAMAAGKGIWRNPALKKPRTLVGNRASRRFHLPHCDPAKRIADRNRVMFNSRWEAFLEGYAPSKRCFFDR
jgi:micrococcal nuclease